MMMGRGAMCIPAFEIVMPEGSEAPEGEEGEGQEWNDEDGAVFAPDYNFEDLDYTVKPDFIDTVRATHSKAGPNGHRIEYCTSHHRKARRVYIAEQLAINVCKVQAQCLRCVDKHRS